MSETNQKAVRQNVEQPFLPGLEYNPKSKSFINLYTDVRPELTDKEIDQLDISTEIKERLKCRAKYNESGKIFTIAPVDGVLNFHGKESVRSMIRTLVMLSDMYFDGKDIAKECYDDLWEQVRQLVK